MAHRILMYKSSTFFRAHGVFRKNFKLEEMLGLLLKQLIGICIASFFHPKCLTRCVTMASRVMPCNGSLEVCIRNITKVGVRIFLLTCILYNARFKIAIGFRLIYEVAVINALRKFLLQEVIDNIVY